MNIKKIIRRIAKGLLVLLGIILVLSVILPILYKGKILTAVKKGINEQLTAKVEFGDIGLGLFRSFPDFTLRLDDLSVAGTGDFAGDTLVKAGRIRIAVDLFSVIRGEKYIIRQIELSDPDIRLLALADGRVNWDITRPSAEPVTEGEPSNLSLSIEKFLIDRGSLRYRDEASGMKASLDGIGTKVRIDLDGDLYHLDTRALVESLTFIQGGIPYLNRSRLDLSSVIEADLESMKFTFRETEALLNRLGLVLEGWVAMPGDDYTMDLKLGLKESEFRHLLSLVPAVYAKDFDKIETSGTLSFSGWARGTYNENRFPSFGIDLKVGDAMFRYPSLPAAVSRIGIDLSISNRDGDPDHTLIDLKKLHAELGSNPVDMQFQVRTPVSDPSVKGNVKARVDLAEVGKYYPLEASQQLSGTIRADVSMNGNMSSIDKGQYDRFQAEGAVNIEGMNYRSGEFPQGLLIRSLKLLFTPRAVEMPVADLAIGKSDLKAAGRIDNVIAYLLKGEPLSGSFESRSSLIDLNEFMSGDDSPETTETDTGALSVIRIPGNIDFSAKASIARLLYDNMDIRNIAGALRIAGQRVTMEKLGMEMLGGAVTVSGYYDAAPLQPETEWVLDVRKVDIPSCYQTFMTVRKLAPAAGHASGRVSTAMTLSMTLDTTMMPVYTTVNGKGQFQTENVTLKDIPAMMKLGDALKMDKFRTIRAGDLKLDVAIVNGRVEVKPTTFKLDRINATVSGWNSLDQKISYDMVLEIPREMFGGQANAVLDNMVKKAGSQGISLSPGSTVAVGALIRGTFLQPEITTDLKKSAASALSDIKEQALQQVKEKAQQEVAKVKEDVSARAQKLIADAEKEAQRIREEAKKAGDQLVAEAEKQGQDLVNKAGNPIAKAAARETSKQLVKKAKQQSEKLQQDAAKRADQVIARAKQEAAGIQ